MASVPAPSHAQPVDATSIRAFGVPKSLRKTWNVRAELAVEFEIKYSTNILDPRNSDLFEFGETRRRLIVIDRAVYELYGNRLAALLDAQNIEPKLCILDATEEHKDMATLQHLLGAFEEFGLLRRAEPIIAIGGGVLLDVVGFAASVYRRGIPYIRVPTTLLALVDASVGAKTAINHFGRRNRLGAYYPPVVSYLDKTFIATQPERDICNGLAEILKMAIIKDSELFRILEENATVLLAEKFQYGAVPVRVINRAVSGMVEELAPNLWEKGLERSVDFGHSFSPLIEMKSLPELSHGEAVALDCLFSSVIACRRNILEHAELMRIVKTMRHLKLPVFHRYFCEPEMLGAALADTVRHRNGNQYLPLPSGIGSYVICNDLSAEEMTAASDMMRELGA